jgi:glycosyltransferase involved in cell wall biosynthesis
VIVAMSAKVSVVIPVFNRPTAVCRAIESVLAQTHRNFELIVVDDASTDETPMVVGRVKDSRLTLIRHERNGGGSVARNTGIRAGSAPYVAFLDSDDEWAPSVLRRQLEVFERAAETLGLVYIGSSRVSATGHVTTHIPRRYPDLARMLLVENVVGETSVGMVRRRVLETVGGFDESLPSCQDLDLWLRIAQRFGADIVPEALVKVAQGDDAGRISANVARTVWGRELYCRKHKEEMLRHGVLHLHLRESGWWQQRRVRDVRVARQFYVESLRANAFAPLTYVLLLATCVPLSWLDQFARVKHVVTGALRGRRQAWPLSAGAIASRLSIERNAPDDSEAS